MGEVAADPVPLLVRVVRRLGRAGELVAERHGVVHPVADRLHPATSPAAVWPNSSQAIDTSRSTSQYRLECRYTSTSSGSSSTGTCRASGRDRVGQPAVLDDQVVPEPEPARRGDQPHGAVAERVGEQ